MFKNATSNDPAALCQHTGDSFMIFDAHSESFAVTALFFSIVDEVRRQDTRSR